MTAEVNLSNLSLQSNQQQTRSIDSPPEGSMLSPSDQLSDQESIGEFAGDGFRSCENIYLLSMVMDMLISKRYYLIAGVFL